jgi:hypothetical protein
MAEYYWSSRSSRTPTVGADGQRFSTLKTVFYVIETGRNSSIIPNLVLLYSPCCKMSRHYLTTQSITWCTICHGHLCPYEALGESENQRLALYLINHRGSVFCSSNKCPSWNRAPNFASWNYSSRPNFLINPNYSSRQLDQACTTL